MFVQSSTSDLVPTYLWYELHRIITLYVQVAYFVYVYIVYFTGDRDTFGTAVMDTCCCLRTIDVVRMLQYIPSGFWVYSYSSSSSSSMCGCYYTQSWYTRTISYLYIPYKYDMV